MKRTGLIATTVILFALSLYVAYTQGTSTSAVTGLVGGHLAAPLDAGSVPFYVASYLTLFSGIVTTLMKFYGGSLVAAVMVLALLVELITLFPAVSIQIKQKKIHMFHKKLVERFASGELTMSSTKHEQDVLYSVNERIHRRGAWLVAFQVLAFVAVYAGLSLMARTPFALQGIFSQFNMALLSHPYSVALPMLAGLGYFLHSLIKIHLKQREDFIDMNQVYVALGFAFIGSALAFTFAFTVPVLLTVYFLTQITFATMRYIIVEENAMKWGKHAQRDLIRMLRTSELHKNKVEYWSRKFNHSPIIRHLNFHLLEEALSMSLAIVILLNTVL